MTAHPNATLLDDQPPLIVIVLESNTKMNTVSSQFMLEFDEAESVHRFDRLGKFLATLPITLPSKLACLLALSEQSPITCATMK